MMKCKRRQATDPQKLKSCQRSFSRFLLEETEAIGVEEVETNRFHIPGFNIKKSALSQHVMDFNYRID